MQVQARKVKQILIVLMLVVVGLLVAVFIDYRRVLNKVDVSFLPDNSGALLSLKSLKHTASRDGIKEWSLEAGSAQFIDSTKQTLLKDLSVTFFPKDGEPVLLTADEGILKIDSNDIEAYGHVVVKRKGYRLDTERIQYEHSRRMIHAPQAIKITAEAFDLGADAMSFELDSRKTQLRGNVQGTIRDAILL